MKTYASHGNCLRYHISAYPVIVDREQRWTDRASLTAMRPAGEELAFASILGGDVSGPEHDRTFQLVTDGESWGIRCELSRGFPGQWP